MTGARGTIFDIDHFAVHDGPGIRTAVYLKGCHLRCAWCHSPESQAARPELLRVPERCRNCEPCRGAECPHGAAFVCGREVSVPEVIAEVLADRAFFESSGGGATITGGEPLFQSVFAAALLRALHENGVHTVLETCGMGAQDHLLALSADVDLFYFDIKLTDPVRHAALTGTDNRIILSNFRALTEQRGGAGVVARIPLIPGYTDADEDVADALRFAHDAGASGAHLLPYNPSASAKYAWVGREYVPGELARQSAERLMELKNFAPAGLAVEIVS